MSAARLPLVLVALFTVAAARADEPPPNLDAVAGRILELGVPGLAIAVVRDDKVILARGYGVRRAGHPEKVDEQTLFPLASLTKAFTAAALASLAEEQKLGLDDKVTDVLPGFMMSDGWVTREMTVRDLLVHRSGLGLGQGDLLIWPETDYGRDEIVRRVRHLKLGTGFRSGFAYDNILYIVAGEALARAGGGSWEQVVRGRLLAPLGMTRTVTSPAELPPGANATSWHVLAGGGAREIPAQALKNTAAAGGLVSSAAEMTRWMRMLLAGGVLREGGKEQRVLAEQSVQELFAPVTLMPLPQGVPPPLQPVVPHLTMAYALGWFVRDYRGERMLFHTGGLSGAGSLIVLLPERRLGMVILVNAPLPSSAGEAIFLTLVDTLLGAPPVDWFALFKQMSPPPPPVAADAKAAEPAGKGTPAPSLALARYAGRYRDRWYGDVVVEHKAGKLRLVFSHTPALAGTLTPWRGDTFVARWDRRDLDADAYVRFAVAADGSIERVQLEPVSPTTDFSYDFRDLELEPYKGAHE